MLTAAPPAPMPIRIPLPSSPGEAAFQLHWSSSGACSATIASVQDEAARAQHHAAPRRDRELRARVARDHAHHAPVLALHQALRAAVVQHRGAGRIARAQQALHQVAARLARARGLVAARRGHRVLRERVHLLVAAVEQAVVAERVGGLLRDVALAELDAVRADPLEVLEALLAERAHLLVVGLRARGHAHVRDHLLDRVVEAARLLDPRAAAEVERRPSRARWCRRRASSARARACRRPRARPRSRPRARAAVPDDHDVGLEVEAAHVVRTHRTRRGGAHAGCDALTSNWRIQSRAGRLRRARPGA